MSTHLSRAAYAGHYGPTAGDRIRLADTELIIEIENDFTVYGDEVQFGRTKFLFVYDLSELPGLPDGPARGLEEAIKITRRTSKSKFLPDRRNTDDTFTAVDSSSSRSVANLYRLALDMGSAKTLEDLAEAPDLAPGRLPVPAEQLRQLR